MPESNPAQLLAQLTDAEKVSLTAGADAWTTTPIERLGIPAIRLGDGPHGVRKPHDATGMSMFESHPATCFPTAVTLGATWDPALIERVGEALGREAAGHGIAVLLGPGVNLKRTPAGGRNFEYFSEDPLVSSRLGAAWVRGVQREGVGASLKHFAANNTEQRRYGVDAVVDERALRELYLTSFESVVREEQPATLMAAYNRLNGPHCAENPWLLRDVLRQEWGYQGVVLSDWGAVWDRSAAIAAGNDLTMPGLGPRDDRVVRAALRSGALDRAALDGAVERVLALIARHGGADAPAGQADQPDLAAHHRLAREAATAGTVLLKNDDGVLPLRRGERVALIGAFAAEPRFQGAGSSHVVPTQIDTLLGSLTAALGTDAVRYAAGYHRVDDAATAAELAEAQEAARAADVAVVVVGLPEAFETEGIDRTHLRLPESHDRLVAAVTAVNPRTVVVLQNGSPVELPWLASVPAVLEGYLGGQASGSALADVLVGDAEPGGRLAESFPVRYDDHPVSTLPNGPATVEYRESLYVGYRYFDSAGVDVAFPFGHGLSYTTFAWSDAAAVVVADDTVELRVVVTNTGERAGSDVVQLYVHDVASRVFRPAQELKGFAKVALGAGESEEVRIRLDRRAFSYWDAVVHDWVLEPGRFELRLARSSRDVVWRTEVELAGAASPAVGGDAQADAPAAYRSPTPETGFPAADFEALLGRPVPRNAAARPGAFTLDTALGDMQQAWIGRLLLRVVARQAVKAIGVPDGASVASVSDEVAAQLNFRLLGAASGGVVSRGAVRRVLGVVNLLARIRPRRR